MIDDESPADIDDVRGVVDFQPQMLRRARQLLRSPEEADDVVQDAVLSLIEAPHLLAGVERLGAWLMTFIARRCVDLIRRNVRRREQPLIDDLDQPPPGSDPGQPAGSVEEEEFFDALADILPGLPDAHREVFVAHVMEERTYPEIAAATGIPEGTLMARNYRAVQRVREELVRRGFQPDAD